MATQLSRSLTSSPAPSVASAAASPATSEAGGSPPPSAAERRCAWGRGVLLAAAAGTGWLPTAPRPQAARRPHRATAPHARPPTRRRRAAPPPRRVERVASFPLRQLEEEDEEVPEARRSKVGGAAWPPTCGAAWLA
jgi:hypothetical protein